MAKTAGGKLYVIDLVGKMEKHGKAGSLRIANRGGVQSSEIGKKRVAPCAVDPFHAPQVAQMMSLRKEFDDGELRAEIRRRRIAKSGLLEVCDHLDRNSDIAQPQRGADRFAEAAEMYDAATPID